MISTIFIDKVVSGIYEARIEHSGTIIGDIRTFDSIQTAIMEIAGDLPPEFGTFPNFSYGGMCTGTILATDAQIRAGLLAERLVALNAELHRLINSTL